MPPILYRNTPQQWGLVTQVLHWVIAALVVAMVTLGVIMTDLPLGVRKLELYGWHKSVGVTVFALTALRLAWRLSTHVPVLLGPARPYERALAHGVHWLFYAVLLALPLSGWLMSSAANFSVSVFGLFTLPDLIEPDKPLEEALETIHEVLAWLLVGLVVLHVAGSLKHHLIWRDETLLRIIPGYRRRESEPGP